MNTTEKTQILKNIGDQLDKLPDYGQLHFHVKKHSGRLSKTDMVKMTSHKFDGVEPTIEATTKIFRLIKTVQDASLTGTLTFSLSFKGGLAEQLLVQDFQRL